MSESTNNPIAELTVPSRDDVDASDPLDGPLVEPSSGAHRRHPSNAHRDAGDPLKKTEKARRNRVTPEQLIELEKEFAINRTPNGAQRKAISERLGMKERQTQIWFQNRRAKAKHQETKPTSPGQLSMDGLSSAHLESYIAQLIREKEPVTLIPCSDLRIGHWTRINPSTMHHEVLAYMSQTRQCVSWFIRSSGLSFKIEVPFSIIQSAQLVDAGSPQLITLVLELHSIPLFFVQQPDVRMRPGETMADVRSRIGIAPHLPLPSIGPTPGEWVSSNDWTQSQQASIVLRHELTGPRTSIIPGIRGFPQHFGLFTDDLSIFEVGSHNFEDLNYGIDPTDFEIRPQSAHSAWNDIHQLHSAGTPSSYSGYESTDSQFSAYSTDSWASGASGWISAHTPASSTHGNLPDVDNLNLEHDILQPVPVHANLQGASLLNQRAQSQPPNSGADYGYDHFASEGGLGASPYSLPPPQSSRSRPQSQIIDEQLLLPGFSTDPTGVSSLVQTNPGGGGSVDYLSNEVNLSRYAQQRDHERRVSLSDPAGNFGNDYGLGVGHHLPSFGSYGAQRGQSVGVGGDGSVDMPFEVDTSYGAMSGQSSVGVFPQMQGTGYDDHLFGGSGGGGGGGSAAAGTGTGGGDHGFSSFGTDPVFSGANTYGASPFSQSSSQPPPPNTTLVPNGSQPGSRRNSGFFQ
ncbi:hypothetical protein FRC19_001386 [Serendipita sp. 401]|nr:hypothetical protein FRC19_001386 [Serendipita sp. 401]